MILLDSPPSVQDVKFYIDAGSLTILLQFLVAFFVAGAVMLRVYWGKVKSFFGSPRSKDNEDKSDDKPAK